MTVSFLPTQPKSRYFLLLLGLFLAIRIGTVVLFPQTDFEPTDATSYHDYAAAILKDSSWLTDPSFFGDTRPPGYPLLIAAVYRFFGMDRHMALYLVQALLSALTCLFIFRLARSMFDERVAWLAFFWSGIYLNYLRYVGQMLRETLIIFLVSVFFYYFHRYLKSRDRFPGVLWGAVAAYVYLIHTDARFLFHLPFLLLLFFFEVPFKQAVAKSLRLALPILLLMVPWTIRNYAAYDAFVLINTRTLDLRPKTARNPTADNRFQYNIAHFGKIEQTRQPLYPTEEERALIKSGLNPAHRSPEEIEAIRRDVYPARSYLHRKWVWFLELWRPVRFSTYYFPFPDARFQGRWSLRHNVVGILLYGWLLPALLAAFVLLYRKRDKNGLFIFLPLFAHSLLHMLQWGRERYRIPMDLLVLIGGFYAVGEWIRYRRARRSRDIT